MESLLQYEVPVAHPWVVHFPVAFLIAAALSAALWMIFGTAFWRRAMLGLLVLGAGTAVAAYRTGDELAEQVEGVPLVEALLDLHVELAWYGVIATGVALAAAGGVSFWLERRTTIERAPLDPLVARLVCGGLALVAAALIGLAAHAGGLMVWGVAV